MSHAGANLHQRPPPLAYMRRLVPCSHLGSSVKTRTALDRGSGSSHTL